MHHIYDDVHTKKQKMNKIQYPLSPSMMLRKANAFRMNLALVENDAKKVRR